MLEPGTVIEGHEILGILGRGGMGIVYEARQLSLGRTVALKVLAPYLAQDSDFRRRFRFEATALAATAHPHIVHVYDAWESEAGLFIAMQLVPGSNLSELIPSDGLDPVRTIRILRPIAEALDTAHRGGLIHRDIKPANVLVGPGDYAYLADFGLTKQVDAASYTTRGHFLGTTAYVAPEVIEGKAATPASDVYSLGALTYKCLTGAPPFQLPSEDAVLFAHLQSPPPRVTDRRHDLPKKVDDVVRRALAKAPGRRWSDASTFIEAIDTAVAGAGERFAGTTKTSVSRRAARQIRLPSQRRLAIALTTVAFTALGVAGVVLGMVSQGTSAGRTTAQSVDLGLSYPGEWHRATHVSRTPGFTFQHPIELATDKTGQEGRLVAGLVQANHPTLLPASFRARLRRNPRTNDPVQLGDVQAYRYRNLRASGYDGERIIVFTVPTTSGVVTVVCRSRNRSDTFRSSCESVARTLQLRRGTAYPVGTSPLFVRKLAEVVDRLNVRRTHLRSELRQTDTPSQQAAIARDLSGSFSMAARSTAQLPASPQERRSRDLVAIALRRCAEAYARLAKAAESLRRSSYLQARAAARRSEAELNRRLRPIRQP